MLNGKHDPPPNGGRVNDLFALLHGVPNILNRFFGRDGKWRGSLSRFEHFGFHKSRFDGQDVDAITSEPIPQCFKICG